MALLEAERAQARLREQQIEPTLRQSRQLPESNFLSSDFAASGGTV